MPDAKTSIHVALTAVLVWLSIALKYPGDTFDSPAFSMFQHLATEQTWADVFMLAAMCGIIGLANRNVHVVRGSTFILSTMHLIVAYCFMLGAVPQHGYSTGTGTYAVIAMLGYYLLFRRFYP